MSRSVIALPGLSNSAIASLLYAVGRSVGPQIPLGLKNGAILGGRMTPMCMSCGKARPPAACTSVSTFRQPCSTASDHRNGVVRPGPMSKPPTVPSWFTTTEPTMMVPTPASARRLR